MTEHDDANVPPELRAGSHAELDTDPSLVRDALRRG